MVKFQLHLMIDLLTTLLIYAKTIISLTQQLDYGILHKLIIMRLPMQCNLYAYATHAMQSMQPMHAITQPMQCNATQATHVM